MENPVQLIFVEDNPSDVRLFQYALTQTESNVGFLHYEHGRDFMQAMPQLYPAMIACILVDLNMPYVNGFELLAHLKQDEDFKHVPVIVFTSTNSNEEKLKCYQLGANAYVSKPLEISELIDVVAAIVQFWVNTNGRVI